MARKTKASKSKKSKASSNSRVVTKILTRSEEDVAPALSPIEKYQVILAKAKLNCEQLLNLSEHTSKTFSFHEDIISNIEGINDKNAEVKNFLSERNRQLEKCGVKGVLYGESVAPLYLSEQIYDLDSFMLAIVAHLEVSEMSHVEQFLYCVSISDKVFHKLFSIKKEKIDPIKLEQLQILSCMSHYYLDKKIVDSNEIQFMDRLKVDLIQFKAFLGLSLSADMQHADAVFNSVLSTDAEWIQNPKQKEEFQHRIIVALNIYADLLIFWKDKFSSLDNSEAISLIKFLDLNASRTVFAHLKRGGPLASESLRVTIDSFLEIVKHCSDNINQKLRKGTLLYKSIHNNPNLNIPRKLNELKVLEKELASIVMLLESYFYIRDNLVHPYCIVSGNLISTNNTEVSKILCLSRDKLNAAFMGKSLAMPFEPTAEIKGEMVLLSGARFDEVMQHLLPYKLLVKITAAIALKEPSQQEPHVVPASDEKTSHYAPMIKRRPKTKAVKSKPLSSGVILSVIETKKEQKEKQPDPLQDLYEKHLPNNKGIYSRHVKINECISQGMRFAIKGKIGSSIKFESEAEKLLLQLKKDIEICPRVIRINIAICAAELKILGLFLASKKIELLLKDKDTASEKELEQMSILYDARYSRIQEGLAEIDSAEKQVTLLIYDLDSESIDTDLLTTITQTIRANIEAFLKTHNQGVTSRQRAIDVLAELEKNRLVAKVKMGELWHKNSNPTNKWRLMRMRLKATIREFDLIEGVLPIIQSTVPTVEQVPHCVKEIRFPENHSLNHVLMPLLESGQRFYLFGEAVLNLFRHEKLDAHQDICILTNVHSEKLFSLGFSEIEHQQDLYSNQLMPDISFNICCYQNPALSNTALTELDVFGQNLGKDFPYFTVLSLIASVKLEQSQVLTVAIYDPTEQGVEHSNSNTLSLVNPDSLDDPVCVLNSMKYLAQQFVPDSTLQYQLENYTTFGVEQDKDVLIHTIRHALIHFHTKGLCHIYMSILESFKDTAIKHIFGAGDFINTIIEMGDLNSALLLRERFQTISDDDEKEQYINNLLDYGMLEIFWSHEDSELSDYVLDDVMIYLNKKQSSEANVLDSACVRGLSA